MYMQNWNDVVEDIDGFTEDILSWLHPEEYDYDEFYSELSRDIAIYTLMIVKKYSR